MERRIPRGETGVQFDVPIPDARLWSLEDPFLYEVEAQLAGAGPDPDVVNTYFGMRKISVVNLPGTDHPYVALNGEPVYLQLALDQSYHPEGFYTFPSDAFMRDEILRARQIGLNGLRVHVKVEPAAQALLGRPAGRADHGRRAQLVGRAHRRDAPGDREHPARDDPARLQPPVDLLLGPLQRDVGPLHERPEAGQEKPERVYLPETQKWVASVYRLAKSLDPTRLVEDNSVCCGRDHTETDLNSWHDYLPG